MRTDNGIQRTEYTGQRKDGRVFVICLLSSVLCLLPSVTAYAATEFESTIKQDGTGDYTTLVTWEAVNQCDLTTSVVLSHNGITGTIADNSFVKGAVSGAYGTVTHCTYTQICIKGIIGTFQNAEQINKTDGLNGSISSPAANVTASSAPDSVIAVAKIDKSWSIAESSVINIDGWTTSSDNYIRIYTTSSARHNGTWNNTGIFTLEVTAAANNTDLVDIKENYVRIEGLQVHLINSGDYTGCSAINMDPQVATSEIIVNNNILKGTISGTSSEAIGIYGNNADITAKVYNNLVYNFVNGGTANKAGIKAAVAGGTYYLYNNTVYGNYEGINAAAGTVVAKNNLANGNTIGKDYLGTFHADSTHNLSGDTTAPVYNTYYTSKQVFFEDETGSPPDLRLGSGDTEAIEKGTALSADPDGYLSFASDIHGEARPTGTLWDIGADESGDNTAPILTSITAERLYDLSDTITLTFDEQMDTSTITTGCNTLLIKYSDDAAGTNAVVIPTKYATVAWSVGDTVATITLDESA